jgi:two-component system, NtrC family, sensor kinase
MSDQGMILLVDDELGNLAVLEEFLVDHFSVMSATSGVEALQMLEHRAFDIIIADQKMPQMTGVELLKVCEKRWPETVRIILTAYTDSNTIMQAINEGHVYRFLEKGNYPELLVAIQQGMAVRKARLQNARLLGELKRTNLELRRTIQQKEEAQDRLLNSAKLSTIGQLTADVIRQIRSHREAVLGLRDVLQSTDISPRLYRQVAAAHTAANQVFHMLDTLHTVAHRDDWTLHRTWCSLDVVAEQAVQFCELDPRFAGCELTMVLGGPPPVHADADKLKQVVIQLLRNAAQAAGDEGDISVSTVSVDGGAAISISDNGPGIDPEIVERVWQPFFTTRGDQGLGIGLEICRLAVEAHGGSIGLESTPGVGAVATVILPLQQPGGGRPA